MAMLRWDPVRDLASMEVERLNRMLGELWGETNSLSRGAWIPPVDIYETADHVTVIKAELPDLKREDIKVTVENGALTISGERKAATDVQPEQYHRRERQVGTFTRSFVLPTVLDASKVSAAYRDGVLTISVPPREEAKPRQIAVQAAE